MAKKSEYKRALKLLEELNKKYPTHTIGMHISTALDGYGDFWAISDKEFCYAIEKYIAELELDVQQIAPQEYVDKIVKDASTLFDDSTVEEEDDDDFDRY